MCHWHIECGVSMSDRWLIDSRDRASACVCVRGYSWLAVQCVQSTELIHTFCLSFSFSANPISPTNSQRCHRTVSECARPVHTQHAQTPKTQSTHFSAAGCDPSSSSTVIITSSLSVTFPSLYTEQFTHTSCVRLHSAHTLTHNCNFFFHVPFAHTVELCLHVPNRHSLSQFAIYLV